MKNTDDKVVGNMSDEKFFKKLRELHKDPNFRKAVDEFVKLTTS